MQQWLKPFLNISAVVWKTFRNHYIFDHVCSIVGLTAGQFIASSVILSTMLNLNYKTAVLIVGIVVTIYAIMGGLWSVTLTDFVQVFLIVIGMIIAFHLE